MTLLKNGLVNRFVPRFDVLCLDAYPLCALLFNIGTATCPDIYRRILNKGNLYGYKNNPVFQFT